MGNRIICISRQFGSGGHEISVKTADLLRLRVYEKELVHLACEYGELSESVMSDSDEKATNPYLFRTVHEGATTMSCGASPRPRCCSPCKATRSAASPAGEECVFVGRCADYVLRDADVRLLRVFVSAPEEQRIARKMEQEHLTQPQAARLLRKMDKQRRKYYETYTHHVWGDSTNYDLCIDTSTCTLDEAAARIADRFRAMA